MATEVPPPLFDPLDVAYIAGLFDGEGTISVTNGSKENKVGQLRCTMTSSCPSMLHFVASVFGGTIYHGVIRGNQRRPVSTWMLGNKQCLPFILAVLPFLKETNKVDRAKIALTEIIPYIYATGKRPTGDALLKRLAGQKALLAINPSRRGKPKC